MIEELIRPTIRGLADYPARDLDDSGIEVRMHRNEAALCVPQFVVDAVRAIDGEMLRTYPTELQRSFVTNLAWRLGCPSAQIAIGNGADELLYAVARTVLDPGDVMLTATPTFGMYARVAASAGAAMANVPYATRWELDPDALIAAAGERTKLVILGNPNNPTGDAPSANLVTYIASELPNALVIIDEVYLAFSERSLVSCVDTSQNVAVIGSFSKSAALAGARVGYAVADERLAAAFRRSIGPYPVGVASLAAADAYLTGGAETTAFEAALRAQVEKSLDAIEFAIASSARAIWRGPANFMLADFGAEAPRIAAALAAHGIAVRAYDAPDLATMVRFCAVADATTARVTSALAAVLGGTVYA